MGSFMVVWFEAPDIEKPFTELATSSEEFSIWFRGQVKDATGVDLAAPPASPLPDVDRQRVRQDGLRAPQRGATLRALTSEAPSLWRCEPFRASATQY